MMMIPAPQSPTMVLVATWWLLVLLAVPTLTTGQVLRGGGAVGGSGARVLQTVPTVTNLQLILAPSNREILSLQDGQTLYLGDLPGSTFNIRALVGGPVRSVRFAHNGNPNIRTEGSAPYAFCGNNGETYTACAVLGVGSHTVTATPFAGSDATGTVGAPRTVRFTIVAGSAPTGPVVTPVAAPVPTVVVPVPVPVPVAVPAPVPAPVPVPASAAAVVLALVHAPSDRELLDLTDGAVIDVTTLGISPPYTFNINAKRVNSGVNSVLFSNGRRENALPWSYCGNSGTNFDPCRDLTLNTALTVTVSPFAGSSQTGTAFTPVTVRFRLTTPPPPPTTSAPARAPIVRPPNCRIPRLVGEWQEDYPEYPLPIAESQGGILGRDMLVFSGFTEEFERATARCYALNLDNPNAGWRRMDDLPIAAGLTHGAVAIVGLKAYLCGGFIGGHPGPHTGACFVYDHAIAPGSGRQWSSLPPLPEGRSGGGLNYSADLNAIIYSGGAERDGRYEDFPHTWMHVLGSNGWVRKADIPFLANHMSYATAVDDRGDERFFYLGGQMGGDESDGNVDDVYEYNPVRDVWIERANMPFARGHSSSSTRAVSCGFIIMAGTRNGTGKTRDISFYDIPSDTWTNIGSMDGNVNTPVCDIDFQNGYLYCETGQVGGSYSGRIRIEV